MSALVGKHVMLASTYTQGTSSPHFAIQYHYDIVGERLLLATGDIQGHVIIAEIQPAGAIVPIYKVSQ